MLTTLLAEWRGTGVISSAALTLARHTPSMLVILLAMPSTEQTSDRLTMTA